MSGEGNSSKMSWNNNEGKKHSIDIKCLFHQRDTHTKHPLGILVLAVPSSWITFTPGMHSTLPYHQCQLLSEASSDHTMTITSQPTPPNPSFLIPINVLFLFHWTYHVKYDTILFCLLSVFFSSPIICKPLKSRDFCLFHSLTCLQWLEEYL